MIVLEVRQVEVDHCVGCGGTWLDGGELELLLDGAKNRDDMMKRMSPERAAKEAPRRCPICEKKMEKSACGTTKRVVVDKCARGHGVWFDRGELRAVIAQGEFPGENRVYVLLNDVFGGGD
jgi:Zn-finger nucleic acid-binding protein